MAKETHDTYVFYKSWSASARLLTEDRATLADAMLAIVDYAELGKEYEGDNKLAKAVLMQAKPQIDANNQRWEASRKAGSQNGVSNNPNGRGGAKKLTTLDKKKQTPLKKKNKRR